MNMVPGLVTYVWFTPSRNGTFDVFCEQLCGIAHFAMRGKVVVEDEPAFASVARQLSHVCANRGAGRPAMPAAGQALYAVCTACHGAQAEGNPALNAPKLSGQAAWYLKRQLQQFQERRPRHSG